MLPPPRAATPLPLALCALAALAACAPSAAGLSSGAAEVQQAEAIPRLRANSALATGDRLALRDLQLSSAGPSARRVRREILRLP